MVINEIHYHPAGGITGSNEFIELRNNSASAVALYDTVYPTNRWKLGGAVDYTFPPGQSLAVGAYALVVDFDPADATALAGFLALHGISGTLPVYGPFSGSLANDTESVELYRPDTPQPPTSPDAGYVPYVLWERVTYSDAAPWPTGAADGGGWSLQRLEPALYGNEPLNWISALPTPGRDNAVLVDSDADGIPDVAEDGMNLDRNDPADAVLDPDGDGANNLQEYLAGTDYLDGESRLRFEEIALGAEVRLVFGAVANRSYSVLYKDALEEPNWRKLADVPAGTAYEVKVVTDGKGSRSARFYRLVTPAWP